MRPLPPTAFVLSIFGCVLGLGFAGLVRLDDWLYQAGRATISERLLSLESAGIFGLLAIIGITFAFGLVWGGLGGHLWWSSDGTGCNCVWIAAFASVCVGMLVGFFVGHDWFGQ